MRVRKRLAIDMVDILEVREFDSYGLITYAMAYPGEIAVLDAFLC